MTCGSHCSCEFSACNTNSLKDTNNLKAAEEGQRPFMAGEVNVYRAHRGGNSEGKKLE